MTASVAPFGRALCAMITPFTSDGDLDLDTAGKHAAGLVADGCDGLVLSGTTGESPTTTDAEKTALLRAVREAVGDGVPLVAGVGSADTRHTVQLAQQAEKAGADGLLVVTPYYSRPPQAAVEAHFGRVADATGIPLMLYDIPGRTGTRIEPATLLRLAEHPRIVAVKDARGDLPHGVKALATTDLAYYSGDDPMNLPWLAVGAAGFVSVTGHVVADQLRALHAAFEAGDHARAREINTALLPVSRAMDRVGGVVFAKAALRLVGLDVGEPRLPLPPADDTQMRAIAADLAAAGLPVTLPS
jgi:4-hydroxy-tetrahydrodipicolinate synthase